MNKHDSFTAFDDAKSEAFAERFVGALSDAALVLMTSVGHRTGLFDTMADLPATSVDGIAEAARLAPRYVREWLATMVTAGVVTYDSADETYHLPPEHAAWLTRAAAPNNIAVTSQLVGVSASVEDRMVERFRDGAGLDYCHYGRFHDVMAEDSYQTVVLALEDHILPLVPGLIGRLRTGIDVIDVGCGAGRAMLSLAQTFPASRFTGVDLCADAFAETTVSAARLGLENLSFRAEDLSTLDSLGDCDLVMAFDAVHDQKDPLGLVRLVRHSLRSGGVFLMQDIGGSRDLAANMENPFAPLLYTISLMHCTPVSVGQGGPGLGAMWGVETAQEFLRTAGFASIETNVLPHDPINVYFVART